jgi:23S rRNA (cytosine1962-C5)-methyltransferase
MSHQPLLYNLITVLYEDHELLAVCKPAGIEVGQLAGRADEGLVRLIRQEKGDAEPLLVINRLSRYESGALILGKNPAITRHIRTGLKTGRVAQEYLAVVAGDMKNRRVLIETGAGQPRKQSAPQRRGRGKAPDRVVSETATVVRRLEKGERRCLVSCATRAESTHALKAQLRCAGLRVAGDPRGGSPRRKESQAATCLHLAQISFHHPGLERKVTISVPKPPGLSRGLASGTDFGRLLEAGLAGRMKYRLDPDTTAYRLLTGPAEGVPGVVAERYGDVVVLQVEEGKLDREQVQRIARWYHTTLGLRAVYLKPFTSKGGRLDDALQRRLASPEPLVGGKVEPRIVIRENGLRFAIKPYDGFSVGLYLDQRENRLRIREMAQGKDVLNLFAYTCGFSVAAAAGGAKSTTSVDISVKRLEWGKDNFALNELSLDGHWFIRSDAADYFPRARRQGKEFDIVILDAPSFARSRKGRESFSIKEDLAALVKGGCALLRPGGVLMVSTNHRRLSTKWIIERIREGAKGRRSHVIATPPLPVDFALDRDHAKTVFAQFD